MRITVLCDNIVGLKSNLLGEHGLAMLIERGEESYLFDSGQGHTLFHNAVSLGKDLRKVKKIFLSHGHYDHTGGLEKVLALKGERDIWIHPDAFLPRFSIEKGDETKIRNIGMQCSWIQLEEMGGRFHFINSFSEIEEGIYLTGEIPRTSSFEKVEEDLRIELDGKLVHDICRDDQSLVIESPKGLILLLGCTHAGLINTLTHIRERLGSKKIFAIMGGTHLGSCSEICMKETLRSLKIFSFKKLGVGHCTGLKAFNRLWQVYKEKVFIAHTGTVLDI